MSEQRAAALRAVEQRLRETCRELLSAGTVQVVIGYGADGDTAPEPVFVTDPDAVDQLVFDQRCHHNLTTYLTRPEVRAMGRVAIVVKGCDERAVVVLAQESQLDRDQVYLIGVACAGTGKPDGTGQPVVGGGSAGLGGGSISACCRSCDVHLPRHSDVLIGEVENPRVEAALRYARLEEFMRRSPQERFAYWMDEFSRCTRCYACRQVCPLCYCRVCVMDKNRPQTVDTSAHAKGTLAFHIARAFHLAGRCVDCGACARACPAGIDLGLLNASLARAVETEFGFRAGMEPDAAPLLGNFSTGDREGFIK